MATRLGSSVVLAVGLSLAASAAPARAQSAAGEVDEFKNQFGLIRLRLRNLAASVRARLDEADAAEAQVAENRRRTMDQKMATAMATAKAEGAYQGAKLKVEVAETEVTYYEAGTAKQQSETIEGDIAMSKAERKRAEDRFEEAKAHVEETKALVDRIGQMPKETIGELMSEYYAGQNRKSAENQVVAAKLGIDAAAFKCEQAAVAKDVFLKYTKPRRLHELRAEVEKAKADMLMKKAEWELAKDAKARLEWPDKDIDDRALTAAEKSAIVKFAGLEAPWRGIIARRDEIETADPAKRAEMKRLVDDFTKALDESERAWSSAREAQRDDGDADTMRRAKGFTPPKPFKPFGGAVR